MKKLSIGLQLLPLPTVPCKRPQPLWLRVHWLQSSRRDRRSRPRPCLQCLMVCAAGPASKNLPPPAYLSRQSLTTSPDSRCKIQVRYWCQSCSTVRAFAARGKEAKAQIVPAKTPCWRIYQRVALMTKNVSPMEGGGDSPGIQGSRCVCAAPVGAAVSVEPPCPMRRTKRWRSCSVSCSMKEKRRRRRATSATAVVIETPSWWRRSRWWLDWKGESHMGHQDPHRRLRSRLASRSSLQFVSSFKPSKSRKPRSTEAQGWGRWKMWMYW